MNRFRFTSRCRLAAVLFLVPAVLALLLLFEGAFPALTQEGIRLILGTHWAPDGDPAAFGMLPMICTTVAGGGCSLLLAYGCSVLIALWAGGRKPTRRWASLHFLLEVSAAVPSVVWSYFFLTAVAPAIQSATGLPVGTHFLTAILLLTVMVLPSLTSLLLSALDRLPEDLTMGGLALGVPRLTVVSALLLPAARGELRTALLLSFGRIIGETTAVLMVSGGTVSFPSFFAPVRFLSAAIGGELPYATGLHQSALLAAAVLLLILALPAAFGKEGRP